MKLLTILTVATFLSAFSSYPQGQPVDVTFTITDRYTKTPLKGSKIVQTDSGDSTFTDAQGHSKIQKGAGAHYTAIISYPNYQSNKFSYGTLNVAYGYNVALTPLDSIASLKNVIAKTLGTKSATEVAAAKYPLSRLQYIYKTNGYPELYDEYEKSLNIPK